MTPNDTEFQAGTIQLPGDYFEKEKLSYNDFRSAWAREALQNSRDAGAKNIDFTITQVYGEKKLLVVCEDDGKGMDKDTLLNVFLKMGGSKKEEGSIGGFGYAKVLLAFAHMNYKIKTQNLEVEGTAADYVWKENSESRKGVRLEVEMTTEDNNRWSMEDAVRELASNSDLGKSVKISLNGEELFSKNAPQPYKLDTALGNLTFDDSESGYNSSVLWVRMNGLAMFKSRLWTDSGTSFVGYLELKGNSLEMLTSNRDALSNDKSSILNKIMQDLSNDREKLKLCGDIDLTLNEKSVSFEQLTEDEQQAVTKEAKTQNISLETLIQQLNLMAEDFTLTDAKHPFSGLVNNIKKIKNKIDDKINKIPNQWYPTNFKVKFSDSNTSKENAHTHSTVIANSMCLKRNAKIAAGWNGMMNTLLSNEKYRSALCVQMDAKGQFFDDGMLIQPGFVFGSALGLNVSDKAKSRVSIMMNPDLMRKEGFNIPDIIDVLHHELNHIMHSSHGESFTNGEFSLRRIMRDEIGEKTLVRAFKEAASSVDFDLPPTELVQDQPARIQRQLTDLDELNL